jgi:hypothetical protein
MSESDPSDLRQAYLLLKFMLAMALAKFHFVNYRST